MNDEPALKASQNMENEKEFSVSKEINGVKKTVRGRKVENGWVICIEKEWRDPPKGDDGYREWRNESKEFISVENPLDKLKGKQKTEMQDAETLLNSILGQGIMI